MALATSPNTPPSSSTWSRGLTLSLQLVGLVIVWHVVAVRLGRPFLPPPSDVFITFLRELIGDTSWQALSEATSPAAFWNALVSTPPSGRLLSDTWASLQRIAISTFWGTVIAAPLAIAAAANKTLDKLISPLITLLYPAPKIVYLPIVIFFLGLGNPSIIFLISLIIFFQVYVIIRDSAAQVPTQTLDSMDALGASRWQTLLHVYLPVSLPAVMTALKISIGTAIAVLFIAESLGNTNGLGYYINSLQLNRFAYTKVYAGIVAISLLGSVLFGVLTWLEHLSKRWQRPS
ncbi:MAG: ABC transporter permease subunit [Deinococcota bacterium]